MNDNLKVRDISSSKRPQWRVYAELMTGQSSIYSLLKYELIVALIGAIPGALGLALRKLLYPRVIGTVGNRAAFGKNVVIRHGSKVKIGDNVIIDDNCVLDAKGGADSCISIGDNVFVGRNTVIHCKGGVVEIGDNVNIGINCDIYSKNKVVIGSNSMVAAYCYIMSGGQYDHQSSIPFSDQSSFSRGETTVGEGCWIGAKVIIQDSVSVGPDSVIGAGAVVTKDIPGKCVAVGTPARVISQRSI